MNAQDVLEVLSLLESAQVDAWVDGGWGIDALIGRQTRDHADLDIAVPSEQESRLRAALGAAGFAETSAEPHNPVFEDAAGRKLDVHFVDLTVQRPGERGWMVYGDITYDVGAFEGTGTVAGQVVRCTTAISQLRSHTGYPADEDDRHDVLALCAQFGLDLPDEYREAPPG